MRTVTIGRNPGCDIVPDDPYTSPRHCVLIEGGPGVWVAQDLGSTNGARISRQGWTPIQLKAGMVGKLAAGDVLVIGRTRMPPFTPERVRT